MELTIATYNVHGCKGLDGRRSPARIARVLAHSGADVLALQELDFARARSQFAHQPREIAEMLDMHWHFHSPHEWQHGHYGCAVLSRLPMTLAKAGTLPRIGRYEPRGVLWVQVHWRGTPVNLVNTHLGLRPTEQARQLDTLLGPAWLGNPCFRAPAILCGDLNFSPRNALYRRLANHYADVQTIHGAHTRFRTWLGLRALDYIFITPNIGVAQTIMITTPLARIASDHRPLVALLHLKERHG